MKELLEELARRLVDEPEGVSVEQFEEDDGTVVLELAVADDDYGKVIGRGGRTANALRTESSRPNRRNAASTDRSVKTVRVLRRNNAAQTRWKYFMMSCLQFRHSGESRNPS